MTEPIGGPSLPQERRVVTAIPGRDPSSCSRAATTRAPAGLGTTLPVFIEKAGGGVLVDVDGNSLIDLGAGIAVVNVGNSADAVVRNVQAQVAAFTHTCFMVTPYAGYVEVCEALNRLTPATTRRSRRCSTPAPRPSRTPSRSPAPTPGATRSSSSSTPTTGVPT